MLTTEGILHTIEVSLIDLQVLENPLSRLIGRRPVEVDPAAAPCFNLAQKWLSTCYTTHDNCSKKNVLPPILPTRVLDIGTYFESTPRLYITNGAQGHYAALSHCWGKVQSLKTTLGSLSSHMVAIPWSILPQLFKDAIYTTHILGLRYLWIDSLCIVQDSTIDWIAESSRMGEIYGNSILTIASYTTNNSSESMFDPHLTTRLQIPPTISVPCRSSEHSLKGTILVQRDYNQNYQRHGPLSKRAWALQEDILSPRILKWTKGGLRWQCRTIDCTEAYPDGYRNYGGVNHGRYISLTEDALTIRRKSETYRHNFNAQNIWYKIVADFASREITYETDRLPAISGVAREVARHTKYDYRAGLWLQAMYIGLLWYLPKCGTRSRSYVAPSWSWASVQTQPTPGCITALFTVSLSLSTYTKIKEKLVNFIGVETSCSTPDSFSQVTSGRITAKGKYIEINDICEYVKLDNARTSNDNNADMGSWDLIHPGTVKYCLDTTPSVPLDASDTIILQICRFSSQNPYLQPAEMNGMVFGLVLMPTGVRNGEYERLGVARISDELTWGWETRTLTIV